jgi:ATP-dependent helicase/nuclease subunit A
MTDPPVPIADASARRHALDPGASFIVQAPAGSGKTELLIQRYLTLLARVEQPEEIVAITFTRKAAAEMRARVLAALARIRNEPPRHPQAHAQRTSELAQAVLAQAQERQWRLEAHPARLRIQTIDALCASLTRQMPVLSRLGAPPETLEGDGQRLYREAARRTLAELGGEAPWSTAIERLLRHLDNDLPKLEAMLVILLGRRDQWLRHVLGGSTRAELELSLAHAIQAGLASVRSMVPREIADELVALARYAALNLAAQGKPSERLACLDLAELPGSEPEALRAWCGISALLLTQEGKWRRSADTRLGFLAPGDTRDKAERDRRKTMKVRFETLLGSLASNETLQSELAAVRTLPPAAYTEAQWQVIEALALLLQLAAAQLRLIFAERGQIDFTGVAQAAVEALGSEDDPTDLGLALDHRIKHVLVDEFQDTSVTQYQLLKRLTAGWEPGDGRTLLLVGDPMQSIYRFREAEVGLFQRVRRDRRLGNVPLTALSLTVNFRSQQGIVDWVNQVFPRVLPRIEDLALGAVPYTPTEAFHPPEMGEAVSVHTLFSNDGEAEARRVVELIEAAHHEQPGGTVAILVRNRHHLRAIVPRLKLAGLRFRAVEIESLSRRPVVRDLLSLTRALIHPADRVAWLALLRAPWCGLTLADLHALAGDDQRAAIWDLLKDPDRRICLSEDGQQRLARILEVLRISLEERRRRPLRRWVEGAWMALGGPACLDDETDLDNARAYFELLERFDQGGDLADLEGLEAETGALYAAPDAGADGSLQIMTMHKAKGLQFDTVIIAGLGRSAGKDKPRLLLWMERPHGQGGIDLLLAPIKETGTEQDAVYDFIKSLENQKARWEEGRLLYVAATRAIRRLHLVGHVHVQAVEDSMVLRKPRADSLLSQLWRVVMPVFQESLAQHSLEAKGKEFPLSAGEHRIQRLVASWNRPAVPEPVVWNAPEETLPATAIDKDLEYRWAGNTIRQVGTVVHRLLGSIGRAGLEAWASKQVLDLRDSRIETMLLALGVAKSELGYAADQVQQALMNTLRDPRGQWLLDPRQREAQSDFRLTSLDKGKLITLSIDRTFIDENGCRWIIDYLISPHAGGDLEGFLNAQAARYQERLERYAALMAGLDPRPLRLGLYFPLQAAWREWELAMPIADA